MEAIADLVFCLLLLLFIYGIAGLPFYSRDYQPSGSGFLKFLLILIGVGWLFSGDDDDPCV